MFFGVVPHALRAISGHYIRGDALVVTEEDLLGMGGEETFERKRERRMKKVLTWLADPLTDLALLVSTTLLHATLSLMGLLCVDVRFDNAEQLGALAFCVPSRSPAVKLLGHLFTVLDDMMHVAW